VRAFLLLGHRPREIRDFPFLFSRRLVLARERRSHHPPFCAFKTIYRSTGPSSLSSPFPAVPTFFSIPQGVAEDRNKEDRFSFFSPLLIASSKTAIPFSPPSPHFESDRGPPYTSKNGYAEVQIVAATRVFRRAFIVSLTVTKATATVFPFPPPSPFSELRASFLLLRGDVYERSRQSTNSFFSLGRSWRA